MGRSKSHGLDGLKTEFTVTSWDILKNNVLDMVNQSYPRKASASHPNDFGIIFLENVSITLLANLLSMRLREDVEVNQYVPICFQKNKGTKDCFNWCLAISNYDN